jgi:hypothetical protein
MSISSRHWRIAFQIAPQLPDEGDDAWAILGCVALLLGIAHGKPMPAARAPASGNQLLPFPGGSKTPRRRANSIGNPSDLPK